jgi:putative inorganic carbon (hco3(-)) transporter
MIGRRAIGILGLLVAGALLGMTVAYTRSALPVVGLGALGVGGVALLMPRAAAVVFAFVLYLNVPVVAIESYGIPGPVAAATLGLLAIPAGARILRGERILLPTVFTMMLAYLGVLLASSALSVNPAAASEWTLIYVTEGLILVVLLVNALRTGQELRSFIWALLVAGAVMGGLSIFQEATGTYDNEYGGFAQIHETGFTVGEDAIGREVRPRLTGPMGEQNRYAQVLVVLLPLAFFQFKGTSRPIGRAVAILSALLITGGVLLTFSRMGLLAIVGTIVLLLLWRYVRFRHVVLIGAIAIVLVLAVAPDWSVRLQSFVGIGDVLSDAPSEADGAVLGRLVANVGAWRTFVDHPILGVGPDLFRLEYSGEYSLNTGLRDYSASSQRQPHNLYLHIAADTGILGLAAFLAIVGSTLAALLSLRRRLMDTDQAGHFVVAGLAGAILVYLGSAMFLHMAYERYFWLLIGLGAAAILVYRRQPDRQRAGSPQRP